MQIASVLNVEGLLFAHKWNNGEIAVTMLIEGKYSHIRLYQFLFLPVVFTKLFG